MKKIFKIIKKHVCCMDFTIATRLIGFVGLILSLLLTTILVNDKYRRNFEASRYVAQALGLDWQNFHIHTNNSKHADYHGKLISSVVAFYSVTYLITSMLLVYATISYKRWCVIPWISWELFGCISKIVGLIYHSLNTTQKFNGVFIFGSSCYIVLMIWWCLIIIYAQETWCFASNYSLQYLKEPNPNLTRDETPITLISQESLTDSPLPYVANRYYNEIL